MSLTGTAMLFPALNNQMKTCLSAFLLLSFFLLPVLPGGAITITPVYDPDERNADPPTGFYDMTPLTQEQRNEIGPSGNNATTLGEARRKALEHALGIIAAKLGGNITVGVGVSFAELSSTTATSSELTLASVVPCLILHPLLPRQQTLYPLALAKSIRPNDQSLTRSGGPCGDHDMTVQFNNSVPFYYGFDEISGNGRSTRFEFVSVVMHETFHGLGFFELVGEDGSWKTTGGTDGSGERSEVSRPTIYDEQLYSEADENFLHELSGSRRALAIVSGDGLSWNGRAMGAACSYGRLLSERKTDGKSLSGRPLLHAPSVYQTGSSVSHFHISMTPDDILEPIFPVETRDMTLALALLKDMGWRINDTAIPASCTLPPPSEPNVPDEPDVPDEPSGSGVQPGDGPGSSARENAGGSSGGCALASDSGGFGTVSGSLFLMSTVLLLVVFGKVRPK